MNMLHNSTVFDIDLGKELSQIMKPNPRTWITCFSEIKKIYDDQWGGFGMAPKFPHCSILDFLLHIAYKKSKTSEGKESLQMVHTTLQKMAMGGIHDHVGKVSIL